MGYLLPGVRVEQILRRPNANLVDVDLYPTLIGPVYRVIRRRKIKPQGPLPNRHYLGLWDADTNTPNISAIVFPRPRQCEYYKVSVSGTTNLSGITDWTNRGQFAGDYAVYNGKEWTKEVGLEGPVYSFKFPILDPGAVPDSEKTEVWIRDAWGVFVDAESGSNAKFYNGNYVSGFVAGQNFFIDPKVNFLEAGIIRGDRLWVGEVGAGNGYYTVDKVEEHKLYFRQMITRTIPDDAGIPASVLGYHILRFMPEFEIDPLDIRVVLTTNTIEVDFFGWVTYDYDGLPVSHELISGQVEVSYRALRKDLVGLKRYENSEAVQVDMESDVWNPLGWALCRGAFSANGNTRPVLAYMLDENSDSAYIDSLSELATYKRTYLLVPMTMSSQVVNAFAAHVTHMSTREISYFRILFASRALTTVDTIMSNIRSVAETVI